MKVSIIDKNNITYDGFIYEATEVDIQKLPQNWKFDWSTIFQSDRLTYKIVKDDEIQGLLKLEWENEAYVIMKNIEVSPENCGKGGRFSNIAELLISFACYQTFRLNKGHYVGYLAFTSKGRLMEYYQNKYGAELVFRERMIIAPKPALELIKKHLKLTL